MTSSVLEQRDLARHQGDDGPLGVGGRADAVGAARAALLALAVEGVHLAHLDAPDGLDGVADLRLAGRRVDLEGVDAGLHERVALLGDDRRQDDVAGVLHSASSELVSVASGSTRASVLGSASSSSARSPTSASCEFGCASSGSTGSPVSASTTVPVSIGCSAATGSASASTSR